MNVLADDFVRAARETLAELQRPKALRLAWHQQARPEQLPPAGDWRTWYLRGGRGAGKTRAGAETLADWIVGSPPLDDGSPGEWAICAPTFGDARSVCAEGPSGLIKALGGMRKFGGLVEVWNRSEGVIRLASGAAIYLDGANDGAFRIQGHNLRGLWADEVGLWEKWDAAWNESIRFAVRMAPSRIVATGTPKMAHPLVAQLLASPNVVETHMRTIDNAANLDPAALEDLLATYGGSTLGRQELEGEFIEAMEGEVLQRRFWNWYPKALSFYGKEFGPSQVRQLPEFTSIVHTWDTTFKDKSSSDFVAGQVWGCKGADRYLLRLWHAQASLNATVEGMRELRRWSGSLWPSTPTWVLVENTANGPDAIATMRKEVDGVKPISVKGDKTQRAMAAAVALETGHCHLPGEADSDLTGRGYNSNTPPEVQAFVEECAMFRADLKHHSNDDQVDAWSQAMNWARSRQVGGRVAMPDLGARVPMAGESERQSYAY